MTDEYDHLRTTGRTTRLILETAMHAINRAGRPVICKDHFDSPYMDRYVLDGVVQILEFLLVKHSVDINNNSITVIPLPKRNS